MVAGRPSADIDHPSTYAGAIDCDLHPALPGMHVLLPILTITGAKWSRFARLTTVSI